MQNMLKEEYEDFINSYEDTEKRSLRVNTLKDSKERFLQVSSFGLEPVLWEKNGFYYQEEDRPGRHLFHEAGVYYIQEASAMVPALCMEAGPGERILDLCAAPGGKSTQLGAAMQGEGLLVCNEIHPDRAKILSENIERMGISNAIVTNETPQALSEVFWEYFDKILVDAPCSGEGMFRKNGEACAQWSMENVELCAKRQDEILDCAAKMLRPGGRLVYSTCTFAPEENEGSVSRFLNRNPAFCLVEPAGYEGMENGRKEWVREAAEGIEKTLRIFPHKVKGEGHFAAVFEKEKEGAEIFRGFCRNGEQKGSPQKEYKEFLDFAAQNLKELPEGVYLRFGEQLYLAPKKTPSLAGLKVLRPGLHLGTIKKNRFEPAHALALAYHAEQVNHSIDFSAKAAEAVRYVEGQTFTAEGEKGWYLITVEGYSLGWGKLAGGVMKNHYPKGLRKSLI
ncbi:MAG: RsmF rRNA methyltransferase first C-terminal domain-containing protein [Lachnospiraceae bacterium]|nr:RsmF rRNA methyltransferase first C-terminal domain-containing protein [Lachnospiraceae bacterium]